MQVCYVGLVDVAVPIIKNDIILGYLVLGQMKMEPNFEIAAQKLKKYDVDMKNMKQYYEGLECVDIDKVKSVANLASMLAKHILTENMLEQNISKTMV